MAGANGTPEKDPDSIVIQVLSAIGAGIGVLGFVAAYGGLVVYVRAREAGVPPDEAVGFVPRDSLVAIGATYLLPAAGLALTAVAVLFLLNALLEWWHEREGAKVDATRGRNRNQLLKAITDAQAELDTARKAAAGELEASKTLQAAAKTPNLSDKYRADTEEELRKRTDAAMEARKRVAELETQIISDKERAEELRGKDVELPPRQRLVRLFLVPVVLFFVLLLAIVFKDWDLSTWQRVGLLFVALFTVGIAAAVFARSDSFLRFALAAFVAVGIVVGISDYYRISNSTKVEPAAALRKDGIAVAGYFVSETDSRVYLGLPMRGTEKAHIVEIPRDNVAQLRVGRLVATDVALGRAIAFAEALCRDYKQTQKNSVAGRKKAAEAAANARRKAKGKPTEPPKADPAARCTVR